MRRALVLPFLLSPSGCDYLDFLSPPDPAVAYLTVGSYSGRCGYDWNGAAIDIGAVPRLAGEWEGGKDAAFLFRFEPVPDNCVEQARSALGKGGFTRVWTINAAKPAPGDPPLLVPNRW